MTDNTIRVGIVGAGANTRSMHIPKLKAIPGVEIVSVCNRSRASSEQVAQEFGIPNVYDYWWELIAAPDTNAIVIGTWPYMHSRLTQAALADTLGVRRQRVLYLERGQGQLQIAFVFAVLKALKLELSLSPVAAANLTSGKRGKTADPKPPYSIDDIADGGI